MITFYVLGFLLVAVWFSGVALVVFAVLGMVLDKDCRQPDVRPTEGIRRVVGKPNLGRSDVRFRRL